MNASSPAVIPSTGVSPQTARVRGSLQRTPFVFAVLVILLLGTLLRLPHFFIPIWAERTEFHPFRQTQTLMMVREILRNGVDFSSTLPLFGPPWLLPMEFPTYQNLAALVGMGLGLDDVTASRLTTLITFQASAVILVVVTKHIAGRLAALVSLSVWEFTQLLWSWSASPTIEFLAVLFVLLGMWVLLMAVRQPRRWSLLLLATGLWSLAFLTKFTTALVWMPFLLGVMWFALGGVRQHLTTWIATVAPVGIGGLVGGLYVRYGDSVKASSPFTDFLTSGNLATWNFGTVEQRLDSHAWERVMTHANGIVGLSVIFVILSLVFVAWGPRKQAVLVGTGLVSVLGAIALFFNLYVIHNYYLIAVAPIMVIIIGVMCQQLAGFLKTRLSLSAVYGVLGLVLAAIVVLSWTLSEGRQALEKFVYLEWRYGQSQEIVLATKPTDGVAVVGCSWSPEILYFADRRGLMLHDSWEPGNIQHKIPEEWVGSAISYVFLCNDAYQIEPLFEGPVTVAQVSPRLYRVSPSTG